MKIVVGIMTCQGAYARQAAVRDTWLASGTSVQPLFLVGRPGKRVEVVGDTCYLDCDDSYEDASSKTLAFLRFCLERLDFDYLFRCDDDAYVDLTRLASVPLDGADYAGSPCQESAWDRQRHVGKCRDKSKEAPASEPWIGPWMTGGAGYWLSRRAAEVVVARGPAFLPGRIHEDKAIGDCLRHDLREGGILVERELWKFHREIAHRGWKHAADLLQAGAVSTHPLTPQETYHVHAALGRRNLGTYQHCGVLTGADTSFFKGLQLLYRSVREQVAWPFMVTDQGLTEAQRAWCAENDIAIQPLPLLPKQGCIRSEAEWRIWVKPYFIRRCPYAHVLWIDSDAVALRNLTTAFRLVADQFCVFPEVSDPHGTRNPRELYRRFPTPVSPSKTAINAGIVFSNPSRDREILDTWCWMVANAIEDEATTPLVLHQDQGALLWTLHKLDRLDAVYPDTTWNATPHNLVRGQHGLRKKYPDDERLFDLLRQDHPEARIVHWLWRPKLHGTLLMPPGSPPQCPGEMPWGVRRKGNAISGCVRWLFNLAGKRK